MTHQSKYCECGKFLSTCRCPSPNKTIVTVSPCTHQKKVETINNWSCPACGATCPPREQPNGVYCSHCRTKLVTCCEGSPQ